MMDKMRRNYQHKLNKKIREMNQAIAEDEVWRGRFIGRQIEMQWEKYSDGSGGICYVIIRMYDKKTGFYHDYWLEYAPYFATIDWQISMDIINEFIVNDLKVWEYEDPYNEIKDWTKIKINDNIFREESNFYRDRDTFRGGEM